jgi:hypothetical protein
MNDRVQSQPPRLAPSSGQDLRSDRSAKITGWCARLGVGHHRHDPDVAGGLRGVEQSVAFHEILTGSRRSECRRPSVPLKSHCLHLS